MCLCDPHSTTALSSSLSCDLDCSGEDTEDDASDMDPNELQKYLEHPVSSHTSHMCNIM